LRVRISTGQRERRQPAEVHRRHVAEALREPGPGWVPGSTYLALWGR